MVGGEGGEGEGQAVTKREGEFFWDKIDGGSFGGEGEEGGAGRRS